MSCSIPLCQQSSATAACSGARASYPSGGSSPGADSTWLRHFASTCLSWTYVTVMVPCGVRFSSGHPHSSHQFVPSRSCITDSPHCGHTVGRAEPVASANGGCGFSFVSGMFMLWDCLRRGCTCRSVESISPIWSALCGVPRTSLPGCVSNRGPSFRVVVASSLRTPRTRILSAGLSAAIHDAAWHRSMPRLAVWIFESWFSF